MAKKYSNNKNTRDINSRAVSPKDKNAMRSNGEHKARRLTKKHIIIIVSILLSVIIISGIIVGAVVISRKINDPDFMKSNLSRYVYISPEDYKGYEINIPLDEYSEEGVQRNINILLASYKKLNEEYKGRYPTTTPLSLGDTVKIYYRGYTVGEDGREIDFDGSSNLAGDETVTLEVGTGNIIDDSTGIASGMFIAGFGEGLVGKVPKHYSEFEKITGGRVMPGDVIYLSYTVISEGGNKRVKSERIDLGLSYIDEIYGNGFTDFFIGKNENGETVGFKNVGEEIGQFICRIGDDKTDTVYSDMKIDFLTRGCENNPINIQVRFPANYGEKSLRGKDAFFDIYIESASIYDTPVFDYEFITQTLKVTADDLSSYNGETLVEKFKERLREEHRIEIEESNHELLLEQMWSQLLSKAEIKKLPRKTVETYYDSYYQTIKNYYSYYVDSYETVDDFAIAYLNSNYGAGLSKGGDWKGYITALAEADVAQKIIFYYIIREENLLPSEEEYREIYDDVYNEVLDYYLELHQEEFENLSGEKYEQELETLKKEIREYYGDSYFAGQTYYYYGTRKLLELVKIIK